MKLQTRMGTPWITDRVILVIWKEYPFRNEFTSDWFICLFLLCVELLWVKQSNISKHCNTNTNVWRNGHYTILQFLFDKFIRLPSLPLTYNYFLCSPYKITVISYSPTSKLWVMSIILNWIDIVFKSSS